MTITAKTKTMKTKNATAMIPMKFSLAWNEEDEVKGVGHGSDPDQSHNIIYGL